MKSESIRKALSHAGFTMNALARALKEKNANGLHNKMSRGGIGAKSDEELKEIAQAIGATYYAYLEFPNGERFGDFPGEKQENIDPCQSDLNELKKEVEDLKEAINLLKGEKNHD